MYNLLLDRETLQSGTNFVQQFIHSHAQSEILPNGSVELLNAFCGRVQASWTCYCSAVEGERHGEDRYYQLALKTVTHVTVAAELAADFHWVLRMKYHPLKGELMTVLQLEFAHSGARLLHLMSAMINDLLIAQMPAPATRPQPSAGNQTESADQAAELQSQASTLKLALARHVVDLGLRICNPPNYAFSHPDTGKWLSLRARVSRNQAARLLESARADEATVRTQANGK